MRLSYAIIVLFSAFLLIGCAKKIRDVSYVKEAVDITSATSPKLNVFVPRNSKSKQLPVLIFVHGGNWNSGRKGTYDLLGRNFASKGVITVIPDYTLSPNANYDSMAQQVARAIEWTKNNIGQYNGNPNAIYVT